VPHAWVRLGAAGEALRLLREHHVEEIVFAGGVKRPSLLSLRPDWRAAKFFARVGYRALGDDGLLTAVIREFEGEGFRVIGADELLGSALATVGPIGRHVPDAQAEDDIALGFRVVRALGALDIGQAAVVQQGLVLGVEAIEGTDALIARCAGLRREGPGGVLVKAPKPGQERRADLPTIGRRTVEAAAAAGLRGIAVEAGASFVLDRVATAAAANRAGLFVVGIAPP
jgi:UDP-2,3-diacylglucosamine hydrolase